MTPVLPPPRTKRPFFCSSPPCAAVALGSLGLPFAISTALFVGLGNASWQHTTLFLLLEWSAALISMILSGFIAISCYHGNFHLRYLWGASGLTCSGLIYALHSSLFAPATTEWLHALATCIGGILFAMVAMPVRQNQTTLQPHRPYLIVAITLLFTLGALLYHQEIDRLVTHQLPANSAVMISLTGIMGFLTAAYQFLCAPDRPRRSKHLLLGSLCLIFAASSICHLLTEIWSPTWWFWHLLKLLVLLLLLGIYFILYNRNMQLLQLTQNIFDSTGEAVVVTNAKAQIVSANPAYLAMTGYTLQELLHETPNVMRSGWHDELFYKTMWSELTVSGHWQGEVWDRRKNGEAYPAHLSINAVRDNSGRTTHFFGLTRDISQQKASEEQLINLAFYDPLTQLPNRALFIDRLSETLANLERNNSQAAIMFIDLDGFKAVNDTFGHLVGDKVLIEVAKRISSRIRKSDTATRLGGDEFAILLRNANDQAELTTLANELLSLLATPYPFDDFSAQLSASIGITRVDRHTDSAEQLIEQADQAMYQAKASGKNRYFFASNTTAGYNRSTDDK